MSEAPAALSRRLLAEGLGSALLLATVVGSGIMAELLAGGNQAIALLGNTIPTGAILVVIITIFGPVSGAHFNPAVTLVFATRGETPWSEVLPYVIAQCLGAIAGTVLAHLMFDLAPLAIGIKPRSGPSQWLAEAVATFSLVLTILGGLRYAPAAVPWLVGLVITAAYWFTASTSFANPAVTLARGFTSTSYAHTWSVDTTQWNGCVTDRGTSSAPSSDYDRLVTTPDPTNAASKFPAEQYSACPQAIMGLSYNWSDMSTLVDNMVANGSTNQPIGLVWGWQSLVGGGPFTAPSMDSNYNYVQAIILLSDGLNTQDRWYGNGRDVSTSVDHRMVDTDGSGTCANFKNASTSTVTNIIYTIQVNTDGDPTSTLLQNCASSTDKFYLLTSASGIANVFNNIGTSLTKLRVAR